MYRVLITNLRKKFCLLNRMKNWLLSDRTGWLRSSSYGWRSSIPLHCVITSGHYRVVDELKHSHFYLLSELWNDLALLVPYILETPSSSYCGRGLLATPSRMGVLLSKLLITFGFVTCWIVHDCFLGSKLYGWEFPFSKFFFVKGF